MKRVFVDSGGFFALLDRADDAHESAKHVFAQANTERWRLVTTNTVVVDIRTLAAPNAGRPNECYCVSRSS
jgi:predicted nucleic acid-binding protein